MASCRCRSIDLSFAVLNQSVGRLVVFQVSVISFVLFILLSSCRGRSLRYFFLLNIIELIFITRFEIFDAFEQVQ